MRHLDLAREQSLGVGTKRKAGLFVKRLLSSNSALTTIRDASLRAEQAWFDCLTAFSSPTLLYWLEWQGVRRAED